MQYLFPNKQDNIHTKMKYEPDHKDLFMIRFL